MQLSIPLNLFIATCMLTFLHTRFNFNEILMNKTKSFKYIMYGIENR